MQTDNEQKSIVLSWTDLLDLPAPPAAGGAPAELVPEEPAPPAIMPYIKSVDFNNGKDTAGKENKPSPAVVLGIEVSF